MRAAPSKRFEQLSRPTRFSSYLLLFCGLAMVVFLAHSPFFTLPYFWDELGQFVPAALDILRDGAWVPHSAVPNVHPPGVMAWLAGVWSIFGYSIPATRAAMLLLGTFTALFTFLLAVRLCGGFPGPPAFVAVLLLLFDPLFYTQSMMAQLDMPAMLGTTLALWLFFQNRHAAAALACTALVLAKETGILLPAIFICVLWMRPGQRGTAVYYVAPFVVLAAWLLLLWRSTGHIFGDPGFAHYNITYALHPLRACTSLFRHFYYLFVADFRWAGTAALIAARKQWFRFAKPEWKITGLFAIAHIVCVSLLGGAELERYLLPALVIVYIAMAAAMSLLPSLWSRLSLGILAAGLVAGSFVNPPYPFPYENNLAMADFVELHQSAAHFLERQYYTRTIHTAWPLTAALRRPEFGYVRHELTTVETSDLHYSTFSRLDPASVQVLVLYSRTWDPPWGVLRNAYVRRFLARFYEYEPEMTARQCREQFGLTQVGRWTRHGQWIEVYAKH